MAEIQRYGQETDERNGKELGGIGGADREKENRSQEEREGKQGPKPGEETAQRARFLWRIARHYWEGLSVIKCMLAVYAFAALMRLNSWPGPQESV